MRLQTIGVLLVVFGSAHTEQVVAGTYDQNDHTVVYFWVNQSGQRHFTDDPKKAPKSAAQRVVHTPKTAYNPPPFVNPKLETQSFPLLQNVAPPTSLPPSNLPPLPPVPFPAVNR